MPRLLPKYLSLLILQFCVWSAIFAVTVPIIPEIEAAIKQNKADSTIVRLYQEKHLEIEISNPVGAIELLKKASEINIRLENHKANAANLAKIGQIYNNLGMHHLALQYLFEAYAIISKYPPQEDLAWIYSDIANVYFAMRSADIAEPYYWNGLKIMEDLDNLYGQSVMYNNIALCKLNTDKPDSALVFFNKSLDLRDKLNYKFAYYHTLNYIGNTYRHMGQNQKALEVFMEIYQALEAPIEPRVNALQLRAIVAFAIHGVYFDLKDKDKSTAFLERALEIYDELGDSYNHTIAMISKGRLLQQEENYPAAKEAYSAAYKVAEKNGFYEEAKEAAMSLTWISFMDKSFSQAQFYFGKYTAYYDTLYSMRSSDSLVRLHAIVQNHLKEVENREIKNRQTLIIRFMALILVLLTAIAFLGIQYTMAGKRHIKRLRQLADASFEAIVVHDDGVVKDVNDRFLELMHIERNLCIGKHLSEFIKTDKPEEVQSRMAEGGIQNYELQLITQDGSCIDVEIMSRPYTYLRKEVRVAAIRDITEKKQFIRSIIEAEARLRELNSTKDRLFSIIAHDLKNPFNAIIGFSELIKRNFSSFSSAEIREMVDLMHESSFTAHTLLENLLEWARIQTGAISFAPEPLPLKAVFDKILVLLRATATAKHIVLDLNCSEDIQIFADSRMLNTIVQNLLTNAIKFTPDSGTISIRAYEDSMTHIMISDSGIGMTPEQVEDLFQMDKIYSRNGTNNEPGTGLGLILCGELIEKHKGKISVSSEIGKGTSFSLSFPRALHEEKR